MNSDFKDLLRLLAEKEAKFLVIGGYAVIHYAEPRYTKDLDILIGTDADNAKKVFEALMEFGTPDAGMSRPRTFAPRKYSFKSAFPRTELT